MGIFSTQANATQWIRKCFFFFLTNAHAARRLCPPSRPNIQGDPAVISEVPCRVTISIFVNNFCHYFFFFFSIVQMSTSVPDSQARDRVPVHFRRQSRRSTPPHSVLWPRRSVFGGAIRIFFSFCRGGARRPTPPNNAYRTARNPVCSTRLSRRNYFRIKAWEKKNQISIKTVWRGWWCPDTQNTPSVTPPNNNCV